MNEQRERKDKLIEAAATLLAAAGGSLPITSLNKALFYLDLTAFRDFGQVVTEVTYIALPAGPVVSKYPRRLVGAMEDAGVALQDEAEDDLTKPVCLLRAPETKLLTPEQASLARTVAEWAAKRTPGELSDYSHRNVGWQLAFNGGLGAKRPALPINMRVAMQQLLEDDSWLDEPADGELLALIEGADSEAGTEW